MSGKLSRTKTVGIACVSPALKKHSGCALSKDLLKIFRKKLFSSSSKPKTENAKIYAICIALLIEDRLSEIKRLVICNDEDFDLVRTYLLLLFDFAQINFDIINIAELRKTTGTHFKSPADSYAAHYRIRGSKRSKWNRGVKLNVVEVNYNTVCSYWKRLV